MGATWQNFDTLYSKMIAGSLFDATPLMDQWAQILTEGNRRGVLSGIDGNDRPMTPLKYRGGMGKKTGNRRVPDYGTRRFSSSGFGPFATGLHDNLTNAQYRELTGPRLAPRGEASRIIKNLHDQSQADIPAGRYEVILAWADVVSTKGKKFLNAHFYGYPPKHIPRYDLRPVRQRDYQFCMNALKAFFRKNFNEKF